MKCNKWTLALAAAGVVSAGSVAQAEEAPQNQVLTALSSTTLSGYIDTSAIWKPGTDHGGGRMPGHTFTGADRMDGFNLHAVKLVLEKPLDEGQWSAGYKADLVFGPDANYYQTILNGGSGNIGDLAVKQAYVALRAPVGNGIDFKVGVFDTIIGYEVFESVNNPNFSRSYGYNIEPTHHTGILASYHVTDWLSVAGGIADTSYGAINERPYRGGEPAAESMKAYMGSLTITLPDSTGALAGSVIYAGAVSGLTGAAFISNDNDQDQTTSNFYVGATFRTPVTGLSAGVAFDYRKDAPLGYSSGYHIPDVEGETFATGLSHDTSNDAYTIAGYLTYALTEKLKLNGRVDYANADAGTFYSHPMPGVSTEDKDEQLLGTTLTLDYSLWDNVVTRAEFRWDHSLTGDSPYGGSENPMKNAYMLAANIVYKF